MANISLISRLMIAIGSIVILSAQPAAANPKPFVTAGYIATFRGLDESIARADLPAFSHLNIAFANPLPDGRYIRDGVLPCMTDRDGQPIAVERLRDRVRTLQAAGARVLVSVGGGMIPACSGDWKALLAPDRRAASAAALVSLVDAIGLDGIDIDLEGELLTAIDRQGDYVPFVAALSQAMKARAALLTTATASYEGGMVPLLSLPYFDLVYIMSYDAIGTSWGQPGSEHAPYAMAERDIALWLQCGLPRERLILGLPFYGYGFGDAAEGLSYREIVARHGAAKAGDVIGKACAGCGYVTFNGPGTIERKARLAADMAGGIMVWEVSQDSEDHRLTRAFQRGLQRQ